MESNGHVPHDDDRPTPAVLSTRANVVRGRLAAALGELDRRRRAAVDVREMARDHAGAVGILTVACATGVLAVAIYRIATARRRRRVARMQMLVRVWRHPELTAPPKEGLLGKIGKVLVVSAARFLLARVLNSASDDMAPPRALTGSAA